MQGSSAAFLVIGAGLQGCSIALELAHRGQNVTLVDQEPMAMYRASLRNEGKIHLGLIYAADASRATAALQLEGALHFRPLLERWLGPAVATIGISTPFVYLVARDSLLDAEALEAHYDHLTRECERMVGANPGLDYLGAKPGRLATRTSASRIAAHFAPERFASAFLTEERAIDTDDLARCVRAAVDAHPNIRFIPGFRVDGIRRAGGIVHVRGRQGADGTAHQIDSAHVVNATWEQRLRLDRMAGLAAPEGWLHRLKYRAIVGLPQECRHDPSATMVLGRYGDVVVRPNGTAFLSWYPSGLRGWCHDLAPPDAWNAACTGQVPAGDAAAIGAELIAQVSAWYPAMAAGRLLTVDAGAIFAYGKSDVDDANSGLHDRTIVGIRGDAGYLSVDPGKLTTAPLFAVQAVDRLLGLRTSPLAS